jgi:hypothetical protein
MVARSTNATFTRATLIVLILFTQLKFLLRQNNIISDE